MEIGEAQSCHDRAKKIEQSMSDEAHLLLFQQCRAQIIGAGKFISVPELQKLLRSKFSNRPQYPKVVAEALHALSQVVLEVGTQIQVIFSVQQVVTLHELEHQILANNRNFEGVNSFDELKLGPLKAHHLVQRQFKPEALRAVAGPPALTAADVIAHIGEWLERHWEEQKKGTKLDIPLVLQALAQRYKVSEPAELGIVIRSNAFLIGLLGKSINARKLAETKAEQKLQRELQKLAAEKTQSLATEARQAHQEEADRKRRCVQLHAKTRARCKQLLMECEGTHESIASAVASVALPSTLTLEQLLPLCTDGALLAKAAHAISSGVVDDALPMAPPAAEATESLLEELLQLEPDTRTVASLLCQLCASCTQLEADSVPGSQRIGMLPPGSQPPGSQPPGSQPGNPMHDGPGMAPQAMPSQGMAVGAPGASPQPACETTAASEAASTKQPVRSSQHEAAPGRAPLPPCLRRRASARGQDHGHASRDGQRRAASPSRITRGAQCQDHGGRLSAPGGSRCCRCHIGAPDAGC